MRKPPGPTAAQDLAAFTAHYPSREDAGFVASVRKAAAGTPGMNGWVIPRLARILVERDAKAASVATLTASMKALLLHLGPQPLQAAQPFLRAYFNVRRKAPPGYRRGDWADRRNPNGSKLKPHQLPLTVPQQHAANLNLGFATLGLKLKCPKQPKGQGHVAGVRWPAHHVLRSVWLKTKHLEERGLLANHCLDFVEQAVPQFRCSHIQRIQGIGFATFDDRYAPLGPYEDILFELKRARLRARQPGDDPDPLLHGPITFQQCRAKVGRIAARAGSSNGVTSDKIVLASHATKMAYGYSPDYLTYIAPEIPVRTHEELHATVNDAILDNAHLGIGAPWHNGLPPFCVLCKTCNRVQLERPDGQCMACKADVGQQSMDDRAFLSATMHGLLDQLLTLRRETHDDRDKAFLEGL